MPPRLASGSMRIDDVCLPYNKRNYSGAIRRRARASANRPSSLPRSSAQGTRPGVRRSAADHLADEADEHLLDRAPVPGIAFDDGDAVAQIQRLESPARRT